MQVSYLARHRRKALVLLISLGFLLPAFPQVTANAADAKATKPVTAFDGETVFRGVFFGRGPVAERLNQVGKPPTEQLANVEQDVIRTLREGDATFFDHFATEMQSGDDFRVKDELDSVRPIATAALAKVLGMEPSDLANAINQPTITPQCFFGPIFFAVAGAVVFVVSAGGAFTITFFFFSSGVQSAASATSSPSSLERDKAIHKLTVALAR